MQINLRKVAILNKKKNYKENTTQRGALMSAPRIKRY